jgi:hypothetical protein
MLLYQDFIRDVIANRPAAGSKGRRFTATDTNIEYYDDGATWQAVSLASSQLIGNIPESQVTSLVADLAAKAPLASPALTGNPTAPTQSSGDNSTKIATTAYVQTQITASSPVASVAGRTGPIVLAESDVTSLVSDLAAKAPLASPAFTGTPTAPTPSTADNSTKLATTAYVQAQGFGTGTASKSDIQQQAYTYASDSGTANAYAVTLSPAPTIVAGSVVVFKATNANTGASTLAVNGGTATAIKKNGSTALASGDIAAGQVVEVVYDGTNFQIVAGGSGAGGSSFYQTVQHDGSAVTQRAKLNIAAGSNVTVTASDNGSDTTTLTIASAGAGATPALVLVEQHTASASAALAFTSCFSSTYKNYVIEISSLIPATNNVDLVIEVSTDGGSTWDTTSGHYDWHCFRFTNSATGASGSTSDASFVLTSGFAVVPNTASAGGVVGSLKIYNPLGGTSRTRINGTVESVNTGSSSDMMFLVGGSYNQNTAVNAFRIRASSGNLTSGTVLVYGLAN